MNSALADHPPLTGGAGGNQAAGGTVLDRWIFIKHFTGDGCVPYFKKMWFLKIWTCESWESPKPSAGLVQTTVSSAASWAGQCSTLGSSDYLLGPARSVHTVGSASLEYLSLPLLLFIKSILLAPQVQFITHLLLPKAALFPSKLIILFLWIAISVCVSLMTHFLHRSRAISVQALFSLLDEGFCKEVCGWLFSVSPTEASLLLWAL